MKTAPAITPAAAAQPACSQRARLPGHSFRQVSPTHPDAVALFREAYLDARVLYPESHADAEPPEGNPGDWQGADYVLLDVAGKPVASGALRGGATGHWPGPLPELKRIYVHRDAQRQGWGRAMVEHLLGLAQAQGAPAVVLETGCRQAPALALYAAMGFERMAPYAQAIGDALSVCMIKVLDPAAWAQRLSGGAPRMADRGNEAR